MPEISVNQAVQMALGYHRQGRMADAENIYNQLLAQHPNHAVILDLYGLLQAQTGRTAEAITTLRRALALDPKLFSGWSNLAFLLRTQKQLDESIACYRKALELNPSAAETSTDLGSALHAAGKVDEALACFQRALQLKPGLSDAHANLAALYESQGNHEQAIAYYHNALVCKPNQHQVYFNLGCVYAGINRFEEAIDAYRRAIEIKRDYADAFNNLGIALRSLGRVDEAVEVFRNALRIKPDFPDAYSNLGIILDLKGEREEALASYRRAIELQPNDHSAHSNLLYALHFHPASTPESLLEEHRAWNQKHAVSLRETHRPHENEPDPDRRLRIGYVSPDFRDHPVGRFILPLLESHDKSALEVFCYAGSPAQDAYTQRIRSHADHWRPTHDLSDTQLADQVRQDSIDILVDLTMHMAGGRLLTFARKPAPVQVTYLAYCSTTGLSTMDYRLTDPHLDPPETDTSCYTEETVRLPETYWCYTASAEAPEVNALPAVESETITFGCLNGFAKVSEDALSTWCNLLLAVPQSRLLLHANPGSHRQRTLGHLAAMGVDPSRCEFVGVTPLEEYFKLYHRVDIALDPFPYCGGTTTCDALWMGVPVVTLRGRTAVGRGGVSILSNLGMPEYIAHSTQEYVDIASALTLDIPRLSDLRSTLRQRMRDSVLMDAPRFTRHVEAAYRQMWRHWCSQSPNWASLERL